ncbi:hypothetical protein K6L05_00260 [Salinicoccus roseus]|uniref:HEPN domain-containing protein n=1 Tax=Salinicoccus roseus TaxID=45670 RepID=UPI001CA76D2A|nr:HEPN domain-containing protein [Salinicoccus roseus]MBY8908216.1 hypothetical protein [Salinicoccus roseus]
MNQFILGVIYNIDFSENFTLKEEPNINIIKESSYIKSLIEDQTFLQNIGGIEYKRIVSNKIHFAHYGLGSSNDEIITKSLINHINLQKMFLQTFLTSLWLVKDNAVNTEHFFGWDQDSGNVVGDYPKLLFSSANGEYNSIYFTKEEFEKAMEIQIKIIDLLSLESDEEIENSYHIEGKNISSINNYDKKQTYFNEDRLRRAIRMAIISRSQSYLPAKISSYISAVESLVSSNRESLVMQVSERVPKLLGGSSAAKIHIHDKLREAYNIRSKYVHGDKVSKQVVSKLDEISINVDEILRNLLIKIIYDYQEIKGFNEREMTNWYKENFMF